MGLNYICATAERFFAVSAVLNAMVASLPEQPSTRLLKHIIRCYLRLSDNTRAREALRQCLPALLRDPGFTVCLKDDLQTRQCAPYAAWGLPVLLSLCSNCEKALKGVIMEDSCRLRERLCCLQWQDACKWLGRCLGRRALLAANMAAAWPTCLQPLLTDSGPSGGWRSCW